MIAPVNNDNDYHLWTEWGRFKKCTGSFYITPTIGKVGEDRWLRQKKKKLKEK